MVELRLGEILGAAEALGDVLPGVLEVHAARPDALGAARHEEALDLGHDRVEVPRLAAAGDEDVAVHRVACPDDGVPRVAHCAQQRRQRVGDALGAHPRDQRQASRNPVGVETSAELDRLLRGRIRPELETDRIVHAGKELDVRAVERARAVPDPEHVRGAVVPVAADRVAPRQRLLVVEQQPLVRRPDVDLVQLRRRLEIDAARRHEGERALDLRRQLLVAAALRRARDEVLIPAVHLRQVGEAALRERADEVQRRGRVQVPLQHPLGIGRARGRRQRVIMDHVAAEDGDLAVRAVLGRRRARLHELPGDAADLQHRQRRAVGQHGRHLEEDLQPLADRDRGIGGARVGQPLVVVERLGTVAGLQQEGATRRRAGQRRAHLPGLAGEDERRIRVKLALDLLEPRAVRPLRLVQRLAISPGNGHLESVGRGRASACPRCTRKEAGTLRQCGSSRASNPPA